ncbi:hypothetical protein FF011L_06540 [Roseimaritima multifibrata]|uniref:Uncharacterized protein n=1 Tax=Roseimaritima multifibrata TaxID=1930274 RepID=A0A517MAL8_9BACT|nr:hypothetical protein [Roseimaritima multifibrata]QDS91918.1 hypothetical protein FF011L_06540 [Roseimaritima multifibrata]
MLSRFGLPVALLLVAIGPGMGQDLSPSAEAVQAETDQQNEIRQWIERLGDESYAARARAETELRRMGLMAFDLLHEASAHEDSEVVIAARHLVSSLQVSWASDSDSLEVREILADYGNIQNEAEQKTMLTRVAQIPNRAGLAALCRFVRFESNQRISREAALLVMQQEEDASESDRNQAANTILSILGANQRSPSVWLRAYADDLRRGVYDAERWQQLIESERTLADGRRDLQTDNDAVLELIRTCAQRALLAGNTETANRLALQSLDLIPPGRTALIDAVTWALDHRFFEVVKQMQQQKPVPFEKEPLLLYATAEAYQNGGNDSQAEAIAARAVKLAPLPLKDSIESEKMTQDDKENLAFRHREIAIWLAARQQFPWAIREYQHIVDRLNIEIIVSATTRDDLSRMHQGLGQYKAAIDALLPIQERLRKDQEYERQLRGVEIWPTALDSRIDFLKGKLATQEKKIEEAQALYRKALLSSKLNADIVIAMFRLQGDEEWQKEVNRELEKMTRTYEQFVASREHNHRRDNDAASSENLASALNQYAWLVANTAGDKRQALRYSLRSLELQPDRAMYLDTLARCHFAVGELKEAIAVQTKAVALGLGDPDLISQLIEFKAAQAANETNPE